MGWGVRGVCSSHACLIFSPDIWLSGGFLWEHPHFISSLSKHRQFSQQCSIHFSSTLPTPHTHTHTTLSKVSPLEEKNHHTRLCRPTSNRWQEMTNPCAHTSLFHYHKQMSKGQAAERESLILPAKMTQPGIAVCIQHQLFSHPLPAIMPFIIFF